MATLFINVQFIIVTKDLSWINIAPPIPDATLFSNTQFSNIAFELSRIQPAGPIIENICISYIFKSPKLPVELYIMRFFAIIMAL